MRQSLTQMDSNWKWQEEGTPWKGVGIYHVTMVVPSRAPILGELLIPEDDPAQAWVKWTELGTKIRECIEEIPHQHPEVQIVQKKIMPDHLHLILYVTRPMKKSFNMVIRGFWQGIKKCGRAYMASINPHSMRTNERQADPIFTERPFVRPMSRRGQLQTMIRYVQMNPQRLATKRLMPEFFWVQDSIEIAGRKYKGVGNAELLQRAQYMPVHVRHDLVDLAKAGNDQPLRDYMNGSVLAAREGTVMVSPFISSFEKDVLNVLLKEKRSIILLADNGFGKFFKPSDALFDAVAEGRLLILSPFPYDPAKRGISRAECVALNDMAEEIALIEK